MSDFDFLSGGGAGAGDIAGEVSVLQDLLKVSLLGVELDSTSATGAAGGTSPECVLKFINLLMCFNGLYNVHFMEHLLL